MLLPPSRGGTKTGLERAAKIEPILDTNFYFQPCGASEPVETRTVASLVMSGSMSCRAYVHQKATVREAIQVHCRPVLYADYYINKVVLIFLT